jgi:hypothetical protein
MRTRLLTLSDGATVRVKYAIVIMRSRSAFGDSVLDKAEADGEVIMFT